MSPTSLNINNLIVQPTWECELNCPDCYLKPHPQYRPMNPAFVRDFLLRVLQGKSRVRPRLLTIAVNDAADLLDDLLSTPVWTDSSERGPEAIQLTANSLATLLARTSFRWINYIAETTRWIISTSTPPACNVRSTFGHNFFGSNYRQWIYNWNATLHYTDNSVTEIAAARIVQQGDYADSIHLILHKPSTPTRIEVNSYLIKMVERFAELVKFLRERYPEVYKKISVDTCYLESHTPSLKTHGRATCSAGINKVCIWPDGSVSGCPYTPGDPQASGSIEDKIKQLVISRCSPEAGDDRGSEFDTCYIPGAIRGAGRSDVDRLSQSRRWLAVMQ